jgi:hypothetical protein
VTFEFYHPARYLTAIVKQQTSMYMTPWRGTQPRTKVTYAQGNASSFMHQTKEFGIRRVENQHDKRLGETLGQQSRTFENPPRRKKLAIRTPLNYYLYYSYVAS